MPDFAASPDYAAIARMTAAEQAQYLRDQTSANRPTQTTPWGTSSWSNTPQVDQAGYDAATAAWNTANQQGTWVPEVAATPGTPGYGREGEPTPGTPAVPGYWSGATSNNTPAPSLADWTTDNWTQSVTLDPADQARLDQQRELQGGLLGTATGLLGDVNNSLSTPLNFSGLPEMTGYDTSKLVNNDPTQRSIPADKQMGSVDWTKLNKVDPNVKMGQTDWSGLLGLDTSSIGNLDAGFGAVESVRDAMMARLQPQRDRARETEIQRLRNQGLSDNTEAFQRALSRIEQGDTDANQQALLGATDAYGDIFSRGLAKNKQSFDQQYAANQQEIARQFAQAGLDSSNAQSLFNNAFNVNAQDTSRQLQTAALDSANHQQQFNENVTVQKLLDNLRAQQFGEQGAMATLSGQQRQQGITEQNMLRQSSLNDLMKLMGQNVQNPVFPSFMSAGQQQAPDVLGATARSYDTNVNAANAQNAADANEQNGLFGLLGTALPFFL